MKNVRSRLSLRRRFQIINGVCAKPIARFGAERARHYSMGKRSGYTHTVRVGDSTVIQRADTPDRAAPPLSQRRKCGGKIRFLAGKVMIGASTAPV
ncbi:hypothetical protein J6590_007128 [Homalodisca vitripennis]|nr:hypothetical protein J6590_007128 [Homalodisca vitripennis]